jgi:hypothetical protein
MNYVLTKQFQNSYSPDYSFNFLHLKSHYLKKHAQRPGAETGKNPRSPARSDHGEGDCKLIVI